MKEFQLLVCAKRSTRDGIGRLSLFEGHADVKQGDAYEGYSLTVSRCILQLPPKLRKSRASPS